MSRDPEPPLAPSAPWTLSADAVCAALSVTPDAGLSETEARDRLARVGRNRMAETQAVSPLRLLLRQFVSPLLIILTVGAVISAATGHWADAVAIAVIVALNAAISFWQEWRAERSMQALRDMAAPTAWVLRGGAWDEIPAESLVPGDIVRLKAGDIAPADLRLLEATRLQIDEAALTGESDPVHKQAEPVAGPDPILADRLNMGFMSTLVANGAGRGVVTATGMATEVGRIAGLMARAKEPRTPLQAKIDVLSRTLIAAALAVVAAVVGIGVFNGMDLTEMLGAGISLSVAAIPEGLPTVVTILLTLGSRKMARENALTRRLAAVETLGSASVICSDKTGTLTRNRMQAMKLWAGGTLWTVTGAGDAAEGGFLAPDGTAADLAAQPDLARLLTLSAFCNDARLTPCAEGLKLQGAPTEGALAFAAAKAGLTHESLERQGLRTERSFPFDSSRKMMSLLAREADGGRRVFAKGAPDVILARASHVLKDGRAVPLDAPARAEIERLIAEFGAEALRTLAVAERPDPGDVTEEAEAERDLVLVGLFGIMDPPRPEARRAVAEAAAAGVRTVMITGDHAATAAAVARSIGILHHPAQTVHTGAELDRMSDEELTAAAPRAAVFARVTPEHKLRIVRALQGRGEVVSMTGDGVNDAPALRAADIGVAMGISGTSVAKDSAALILLDDDFSSIVAAVREGRRIYDNLLKFIRQALTANVAEVSTILLAFLLLGETQAMPLTPLMILWVNLVSDGIPALTLGLERAEADVMRRPPRPRDHDLFGDGMKERIVLRGLAIGGACCYVFQRELALGGDLAQAQTLAFFTLVTAQVWHLFDARTTTTLFRRSPFGNRRLLAAAAASILLTLGAIHSELGTLTLGAVPVEPSRLLGAAAIAALPTLVLSGVKEIFRLRFL